MTREGKAKAYDEAIAKAQKELQTCGSTDCDAARQIYRFFPELKENEDERIRKSIIAILNNYVDNSNTFKPKMLAWLEKQSQQKPIVDGILTATNYDKWFQNCKLPKFKVGDWVVFIASENVYQVEKIENYEYTLRHILGGSMPLPFSSEELIRPWTIKDAKPGDVLVASDNSTFLFKCTIDCACKYYVALTTDGVVKFNEGLEHFWETSSAVHPATKEQRELLFQKMREAGYEWDTEKKVLKTVEDEPENFKQQLASEMADLIIDYVKQKPADIKQNLSNSAKIGMDEESKWTEEDEKRLQSCISSLQGKGLMGGVDTINTKWLKSLKQRIEEQR